VKVFQQRLQFCIDHLSCLKMAVFQFYHQSEEQTKVGWAWEDSFLVKRSLVKKEVLEKFRTASVVQWSEFLTTDPGVPGSIPGHYQKKNVVGLERGPLSL
jgi:hypothetical protein